MKSERELTKIEIAGRKLAAGGLISLGALGLAGCAPEAQGQDTPWVDPNPTETTTSAPVAFERGDPLPTNLQEEADSEANENGFGSLAEPDQLAYYSWLTQALPEFAQRYAEVSGLPVDTLPTPSKDNTGEEIFTLHMYALRMAESFENDEDTRKAVMAAYGPTSQQDAEAMIDSMLSDGKVTSVDSQALGDRFAVPEIISTSPVAKKGEFWTVIIKFHSNEDGQVDTASFHFVEFTDYEGQTTGEWVRDL